MAKALVAGAEKAGVPVVEKPLLENTLVGPHPLPGRIGFILANTAPAVGLGSIGNFHKGRRQWWQRGVSSNLADTRSLQCGPLSISCLDLSGGVDVHQINRSNLIVMSQLGDRGGRSRQ